MSDQPLTTGLKERLRKSEAFHRRKEDARIVDGSANYIHADLLRDAAAELARLEAALRTRTATVDDLLEGLQDVVNQAIGGAEVDSGGLGAYGDALRLLAKHGLFDIKTHVGRRVIGTWNLPALEALCDRQHARFDASQTPGDAT